MIGRIMSFLFTPSGLTPHGFCLLWQPGLIWTDAAADFATGLAYFTIPVALATIIRRQKDLLLRPILWLFVSFILVCGITHWLDVLTLWVPVYAVQGAAKAIGAAISVGTAIALCRVLPEMLSRPAFAEFQQVHEKLRQGRDFLDRIGKVAGVGGWEIELATGRVTWSAETYHIHALPLEYEPTLEAASASMRRRRDPSSGPRSRKAWRMARPGIWSCRWIVPMARGYGCVRSAR
jgi:hypothetical protein